VVLTLLSILKFALRQSSKGFKHVWTMPLSRYTPSAYIANSPFQYNSESSSGNGNYSGGTTAPQFEGRTSEFLQYEKQEPYNGGGLAGYGANGGLSPTGMGYSQQGQQRSVAPSIYHYQN
jgi:hypothetical protein